MDYEIEELNELAVELKSEIKKFMNALVQLETDVTIISNGDENGAYWSGPSAYYCIQGCLGHIDHNYELYSNLEKCSNYLDSLIK